MLVGTVLSDVALVIGALAALVAAAAGCLAVVRGRRMEATMGSMAVKVDSIDHATNQQPKSAPTLPQRLDTIEEYLDTFMSTVDIAARFEEITSQFAVVNGRLGSMAVKVDSIDHATNQQPPGAATLPERLDTMQQHFDEQHPPTTQEEPS